MSVTQDEFRSGMRQLAAAVNVITTVHEGQRAGMTATAVMSLTAEPPHLGVAVNRSNASFAAMVGSGVFAVNVLPHDQLELAATFGGAAGARGEERFTSGRWDKLETGAPTLIDSAASFDCRIVQQVEFSSHVLLVGLVKALRVAQVRTPLLYIDGTWASLVRATEVEFDAYERVVEEVAEAMDAALARPGSARDQLSQFSRAFVEVNCEKLDVLRDFFSHETFAPASRLTVINQRKREIEAKLRSLLLRGAEAGEFDIPDPGMAANAIIGMLNSIHRWPNREEGADGEALALEFGNFVAAMVDRRAT